MHRTLIQRHDYGVMVHQPHDPRDPAIVTTRSIWARAVHPDKCHYPLVSGCCRPAVPTAVGQLAREGGAKSLMSKPAAECAQDVGVRQVASPPQLPLTRDRPSRENLLTRSGFELSQTSYELFQASLPDTNIILDLDDSNPFPSMKVIRNAVLGRGVEGP